MEDDHTEDDLAECFEKNLKISSIEFDQSIFQSKSDENRFFLVAKLMTDFPIHMTVLKKIITQEWRCEESVKTIDLSDYVTLICFSSEIDRNRILSNGPWSYNGIPLVLNEWRDWSELPEELLGFIAKRLPSSKDFCRFGRVCRSWRSVSAQRHYYPSFGELPWLMLPEKEDRSDNTRRFSSLLLGKEYNLNLPEACGKRCWGSPYGWLITISFNWEINLLNPLSRLQISLPSRPSFNSHQHYLRTTRMFCGFALKRAILSSTPSSSSSSSSTTTKTTLDHCIVMLIYYEDLAFAKPGDEAWTLMKSPTTILEDIICFDGVFYAVDGSGTILICDIDSPHPQMEIFALQPKIYETYTKKYLVESLAEMYLVVQSISLWEDNELSPYHQHETDYIEVYKLDLCTRKWVQVYSLGDQTFFVGNNSSFSVCASGYHSDCIYFTDEYEGSNMGVFNLKDGTIMPLYEYYRDLSHYCPPLWITLHLR